MMKILLFLSPFIAIGIVYYIKTRMQDKHKPYVLGSLWMLILGKTTLVKSRKDKREIENESLIDETTRNC